MLRILLVISVLTCTSETLRPTVARSYLRYLRQQGDTLPSQSEVLKTRLAIFGKNLELIDKHNAKKSSFKLGINRFTDKSEDELKQYHGLNYTMLESDQTSVSGDLNLPQSIPESVDWVSQGYVTPAKDQGKCGSCWAFGSVVALEGTYKRTTNILKNFAEQEYLDCVFTTRDGCTGGATHVCFDYTQKTGHMASQQNYPYTATDQDRNVCDLTKYKNSMISAKVTGRVTVRHVETEENTVKLLALQPITLFIEATRTLHAYKEGILMDPTCWSQTNHAVAGVGYTPKYIIVKNSWGSDWGESGFFKLLRGWRNCGLYLAGQYPVMELTGDAETEQPALPALYDHTDIVGPDPPLPDPDCSNAFGDRYCERMSLTSCHSTQTREVFCRKTCQNCWIFP